MRKHLVSLGKTWGGILENIECRQSLEGSWCKGRTLENWEEVELQVKVLLLTLRSEI